MTLAALALAASAIFAPATHSVSLTWNVVTDPNYTITGYNVYRSTVSGGPYNKRAKGLPSASWTDTTNIISGHTFCYVVTATGVAGADGSTAESLYSNESCVSVQ